MVPITAVSIRCDVQGKDGWFSARDLPDGQCKEKKVDNNNTRYTVINKKSVWHWLESATGVDPSYTMSSCGMQLKNWSTIHKHQLSTWWAKLSITSVMSLFFCFLSEVYPRYDQETPDRERRLIHEFARSVQMRSNEVYDPDTFVLKWELSNLKSHAAPLAEADLANPHIRFFVDNNPGWCSIHACSSSLRSLGMTFSELYGSR